MLKNKILIVSPYPIKNPQHGGQKRAKALFDLYSSIFESVKFVGVYHRGFYTERGEDDILLGQPDVIAKIDENPQAGDLIAGEAIDNDIHVRSHMAKLLQEYKPDIIQIEQAYPYLGLSVLLKELQMTPKLILSSHNVEYRMKEDILKNLGVNQALSEPLVKRIKKLEERLSKKADLVIAVSREDAEAHKAMGARRLVIAPNGISKVTPSKEALVYWAKFKRDARIQNAVTFVGSGHPPNWVSFLEMVGEDTSFMPAGSKILLGGGIAEYFKATYDFSAKNGRHQKLWSGLVPLSHLSEDRLAGLLYESDVILLPITSGGGSNLKTAEAILSGKKVVATSYAFRGFEKYRGLPNIYVEDSPSGFRKAILAAIDAEYVPPRSDQAELASQVEWRHCLQPLSPELARLSRTGRRERIVKSIKNRTPKPVRSVGRRIKRR